MAIAEMKKIGQGNNAPRQIPLVSELFHNVQQYVKEQPHAGSPINTTTLEPLLKMFGVKRNKMDSTVNEISYPEPPDSILYYNQSAGNGRKFEA